MYRILIVDDERIEREGLERLIHSHELELETILAENGEVAWEIIRQQPIDIVITDIKMPFMDGLELAERIAAADFTLEMIIYSAFHEFEYARRALQTKISHYLLKPLQISEFLQVIGQAMEACKRKETEKRKQERLLAGYNRGVVYEKERLLLDALNGTAKSPELYSLSGLQDYYGGGQWLHLILAESRISFFDLFYEEWMAVLTGQLGYEIDSVNLSEHQTLLVLKHKLPLGRDTLQALAEQMIRITEERYAVRIELVVGRNANHRDRLFAVYSEMEQMRELKFFLEHRTILFAEEQFAQAQFGTTELQPILERVYQCLEYNDGQGAAYSLELLFSFLKAKGQFSSLYTKYLCSDIMNKVVSKENGADIPEMDKHLERIGKAASLQELKEQMGEIFTLMGAKAADGPRDEANLRLIRGIKDLIGAEYDQDLSLEGIAERVYLTPSYLSYLFKKETGQSLIRYITQVRMEKAAELLTGTNLKIVDIYRKLGYRSSTYFIQTFRHYYGVTPVKFREASP